MQSLALVAHVILAVGVIGLVLMQHGKGADAGAAFGSGASATVFGARGAASFLTRATTALAVLFFLTSITLFYLAANRESAPRSVTDLPSVIEQEAEEPAAPAPAGDLPGGVESGTEAAADVDDGAESESATTPVDAPLAEPAADSEDLPPAAD